ncbi:MAG: ABC transporter ATP-binding protein [Micrococcus sp.]|nr:ABC transporter ATP-binding protein [Micrococcus sp.]
MSVIATVPPRHPSTDATAADSPAARTDAPTPTAGASSAVRFERVGRTFPSDAGPRTVLREIDLEIAPGEILAILGASGCGKSTLLRAAAGLDRGFSGSVVIGERPVRPYDERTAVGFQEPRLLPWRTIERNVALGLPRGTPRREGAEHVAQLLDLVGLSAAAQRRPREVSGGMAQRASLARALARRPEVLLLDEPFGALDALTRLKMQDLLLDVHAATQTTVLLVTHDVEEAVQLADRILLLGADPEHPETPGATMRQLLRIPGERPRDRSSAELAALRSSLLEGLGVDAHRR